MAVPAKRAIGKTFSTPTRLFLSGWEIAIHVEQMRGPSDRSQTHPCDGTRIARPQAGLCGDRTVRQGRGRKRSAGLHARQRGRAHDIAFALPDLIAKLKKRGVKPLSVGRSIVATWEPHQATELDVIKKLGLELEIIYNKGAVMILPSGVNKATGLAAAWRIFACRRAMCWLSAMPRTKPELVVEGFDHATRDCFRHGTKLLRWRPDKLPSQCTLQQIE